MSENTFADTIFALATPTGVAGVAVLRISGPRAEKTFRALRMKPVPARQASLRKLWDGEALIDEALVIRFEAGQSFTGEDVVELQPHGSPAVVAKLLEVLGREEGFRLAAPGEFTRRAFESGRLDLVQVEGLADLIAAESEAQRRLALDVYSGKLSKSFELIRAKTLRAAALCEAVIDFVDEEVPEDVFGEVAGLLSEALLLIEAELDGAQRAQQVQKGFEVAIAGAPNSGKSSLLNALVRKDAAIVSSQAGTTRDVVEARLVIGGVLVTLLDTAGLRETSDEIEAEGVRRARRRAEAADLRLFLHDGDGVADLSLRQEGDRIIETKGDLSGHAGAISSVTGEGIAELLSWLEQELANRVSGAGLMSSGRQNEMLMRAKERVSYATQLLSRGAAEEVVAEEIRQASRHLDAILGRIDVEDILGEVFSSFCIGK